MIKVALYLENKNISEVDLSQPELGNPGIGGTPYNFITFPYYFCKYYSNIEFIFFANSTNFLPHGFTSVEVVDCNEAIYKAAEMNCELFIWRPTMDESGKLFVSNMDAFDIKIIAWVHNSPNSLFMKKMASKVNLKRFVCVSQEQLDRLRDHPIFYKAVCIYNGFDTSLYKQKEINISRENNIVYIGSIVKAKGFHYLARTWKRILKQVPNAKLYVVGSGKLYDRTEEMGKWGIAEEGYESSWRDHLSDENGTMLDSVNFLGTMGVEKIEVIHNATIGVVNPSGLTENCPGSAIEFQAASIPVVSGAYNGLLDTVIHKKTGLLGRNDKDFIDNIVFLSKNVDYRMELGRSAADFIDKKFNHQKISKEWFELFQNVMNNTEVKVISIKQFPFHDYKVIREIIRLINRLFPNKNFIPALSFWKTRFKG